MMIYEQEIVDIEKTNAILEMAALQDDLPLFSIIKKKSGIKRGKIKNPEDMYKLAYSLYDESIEIYESSYLILLNQSNEIIGTAKLSSGGITFTTIDVRLVAHFAISSMATAVALVHNHPSGNIKPSDADLKITEKVRKSLELLDITLLDHIIVVPKTETESKLELFYSFANSGYL